MGPMKVVYGERKRGMISIATRLKTETVPIYVSSKNNVTALWLMRVAMEVGMAKGDFFQIRIVVMKTVSKPNTRL